MLLAKSSPSFLPLLLTCLIAITCSAPSQNLTTRAIEATPNFPAKSSLSISNGMSLKFLALGVGTQNYTCQAKAPGDKTLQWTLVGAKATLKDLSKDQEFLKQLETTRAQGKQLELSSASKSINSAPLLGDHYFVKDSGVPSTNSPKFDFASTLKVQGNAGFLIAKKAGAIDAPTKPLTNVQWLKLETTSGSLAKVVFRTNTQDGSPPAGACAKASENLESKYSALYWFYE